MRLKGKILFAIFLLFFAKWVSASENIWLSNTPPEKISKKIRHGMHGVSLIKGKDGKEKQEQQHKFHHQPCFQDQTPHAGGLRVLSKEHRDNQHQLHISPPHRNKF